MEFLCLCINCLKKDQNGVLQTHNNALKHVVGMLNNGEKREDHKWMDSIVDYKKVTINIFMYTIYSGVS